ncbi:hypothetical protein KEJ47_00400 [Candidatus Bathyarchaeota archaeon]|nr:hypothetical protein [Candidatus Bathyarchaeota archaeon]
MKEKVYCKNPVLMNLLDRREDGSYFEFLIVLENVPGAIAKVSSTISSFNANIWSGFHATIDELGGAWAFFLEAPPSVSVDSLVKKIEALKEVKELRFRKLDKTEYFDVFFFPLCIGGNRVIILTHEAFQDIKQHLIELLGTGGESILFNEGLKVGNTILRNIPATLKINNEKLNFLKDFLRATGWGIIEYQELNPLRKTGEIYMCNHIEIGPKYSKRCHFIRGILTSFLRAIFDDEGLSLVETECIGAGASKCVFKLV